MITIDIEIMKGVVMMNLYMVSLGGKVEGANIEVHDVQFVVAQHIDDTIELLKDQWYGIEEKLHMDSYTKIMGADGHVIKLSQEEDDGEKKLYFVYMGGYSQTLTQELHRVELLVGESLEAVKKKAMKRVGQFEVDGHVDQIVEVGSSLLYEGGNRYFIQLEETWEEFVVRPEWIGYKRLDR